MEIMKKTNCKTAEHIIYDDDNRHYCEYVQSIVKEDLKKNRQLELYPIQDILVDYALNTATDGDHAVSVFKQLRAGQYVEALNGISERTPDYLEKIKEKLVEYSLTNNVYSQMWRAGLKDDLAHSLTKSGLLKEAEKYIFLGNNPTRRYDTFAVKEISASDDLVTAFQGTEYDGHIIISQTEGEPFLRATVYSHDHPTHQPAGASYLVVPAHLALAAMKFQEVYALLNRAAEYVDEVAEVLDAAHIEAYLSEHEELRRQVPNEYSGCWEGYYYVGRVEDVCSEHNILLLSYKTADERRYDLLDLHSLDCTPEVGQDVKIVYDDQAHGIVKEIDRSQEKDLGY